MSTEPHPTQPEPSAPRCCPFSGSIRIARTRQAPDGAGLTKVEEWCAECDRAFFWFLQEGGPVGEHLPSIPETLMTREPLQTKERRCPACASEAVAPANHLLAMNDKAINVTKEKFQCAACGTAFWFVR